MSDKREWTDDMGEISGFGGSYEAGCRAMVLAGIAWFDAHPDADPTFQGFKNVFGLITESNEDAKALEQAIMDAEVVMDDGRVTKVREEATGAMYHAAVRHCLAYRRLGWDEYCRQLRAREKDSAHA